MAEDYSTLTLFYAGWDRYQRLLVDAVADLTGEQLALRPAPGQWSVRQLAAHIIATRVGWFQFMGAGDETLAPLDFWDGEDQPPRLAAELVSGFTATWAMIAACLAHWTPADLGATFYHKRSGEYRTRQWVIWHVLEHDLNHGGELFLTLGIHGLPTPDL